MSGMPVLSGALTADEEAEFAEFALRVAARQRAQQLVDAYEGADLELPGHQGEDSGAAGEPDTERAARAVPKTALRTKLHASHFAFMRAYVEGIPIDQSWDRYMSLHGMATDIRVVRGAVAALRSDIAAAARRAARPGMARLLKFDVASVADIKPLEQPSLEDFAFEHGYEDFSVSEQLEAYTKVYGTATQRQSRHARLLRKQLDALRWLEKVAAEKPVPDDAIAAWLIPELASPLEHAGVVTLRQLVERINGMAQGWYKGLKGIGSGKAARIVDWLRDPDHAPSLAIGAHVDLARRAIPVEVLDAVVLPSCSVVPLEKFVVPANLDGGTGRFRAPKSECMLAADTDMEAMLTWVRSKKSLGAEQLATLKAKDKRPAGETPGQLDWLRYLSSTQKVYLSEVYRLMLWSILERGKALSSLDFEDAAAYRDFLADPQPLERWCSKARGRERYGPAWRPFAGALAPSAVSRALTVLQAFYAFLISKRYLVASPWSGLAKPALAPTSSETAHVLSPSQWQYLNSVLDLLEPTSANLRLRFGLRLMYVTGLRRAEVVGAKVSQLHWVSYPSDEEDPEPIAGWEIRILGKGNKLRCIPLPSNAVADLSDYLVSRGLDRNVSAPENQQAHLLGQAVDIALRAPWSPAARAAVDPLAGIGAQTWYDQLKAFFAKCAEQMNDRESSTHFERASTHWLRHTKVTHSLAAGTATDLERQVVGHASLATTSIYSHVDGKRRMRGAQKFFSTWGVQRGL